MAIITYEHQFRVRYKDTDQMGIMHHSNYIVLYEMARTEWLLDKWTPTECDKQEKKVEVSNKKVS